MKLGAKVSKLILAAKEDQKRQVRYILRFLCPVEPVLMTTSL